MAEWPVEVVEYNAIFGRQRTPYAPGETVPFARYYMRTEAGEREFDGMAMVCPKCSSVGSCPMEGRSWTGSGWIFAEQNGKLTMNPSIVCDCGGHYWLRDGVLKDV